MADSNEQRDDLNDGRMNGTFVDPNRINSDICGSRSIENFILHHYEQQQNTNNTEDVEKNRLDDFLKKALSESQRMDNEVLKSKEKMEKLRAEFGDALISSWRQEHAAEVLSPEQARCVEESQST